MSSLIAQLWAWLRTWWASQFMDEPPPVQIEPEEEEMIYHILPHPEEVNQPLPHNEEYCAYRQPGSGQSAAVTKGPEYRDGRRL